MPMPFMSTSQKDKAMASSTRPNKTQQYYFNIAHAVRLNSSCAKRLVGAVLVLGDRIVSTGYNGTPEHMDNCDQGGCFRCTDPTLNTTSANYDLCICVHAEQNALLTAARYGIPVADTTIYTTLAPCFTCMKELLQAHVRNVYYLGAFPEYEEGLKKQLGWLLTRFKEAGGETKKLVVPGIDPNMSAADRAA
jgi:dCMP deaminase